MRKRALQIKVVNPSDATKTETEKTEEFEKAAAIFTAVSTDLIKNIVLGMGAYITADTARKVIIATVTK